MRTVSFLRTTNLPSMGVMLLAILISLTAGISGLIFSSPLSPLYVMVGVLAPICTVVLLFRKTWALYAAVFIVFLPQQIVGLLPITFLARYLITLVVLLAGLAWLLNAAIQQLKITWTGSVLLMLGFAAWSILSLLWAPNLTLGRQMLITILLDILLLVLLANEINSLKVLNGLMTTLALVGWMLVLAGAGTVLTQGYTPGSRLSILGINENDYGIQLMLAMPGVLWLAIRPDGRRSMLMRLMGFAYMVLVIGLVAMSGSRGSAISLIFILLAFCFWKPTRSLGVFCLGLMALGVILLPLVFSTTLERFAVTEGDTMLGGREVLWKATWNLIVDHPWTGVGIGNARHEVIPYVMMLTGPDVRESVPSHNPILQVWAETGLPGILLYLGSLGSAAALFVRQYFLRRKYDMQVFTPYFALISSLFLGYMFSWIKGGGIEFSLTYFLMLSLLLIPASLNINSNGKIAVLKE